MGQLEAFEVIYSAATGREVGCSSLDRTRLEGYRWPSEWDLADAGVLQLRAMAELVSRSRVALPTMRAEG